MAKQTLGQGDSNVVVRNQVVYGALPQDVIDRMGDTTLALQTTEQNVLPAINELKSNLTHLEEYSTTEQVVGKWIDGSTIYRRVFTLGNESLGMSFPTQTFTDTTITGTNINVITRVVALNGNGFNQPFGATTDGGSQNYVRLYNYRSSSTYVRYLVLEYTKINE